MQLSVIIVNYNVEHYLKQCLLAVEKAIKNIDAEIITDPISLNPTNIPSIDNIIYFKANIKYTQTK